MITGEGEGGESETVHIIITGSLQHSDSLQVVVAGEHVVQHVLLLPGVSDLPGGPVQCLQVIAGGEGQLVLTGHVTDHWLPGLSIEVSGDDERSARC